MPGKLAHPAANGDAKQAASTSQPNSYFVRRGSKAIGPLTKNQLFHVIRTRQISANCGVSRTINGPWQLISQVPQLAALLPTTEAIQPEPVVGEIVADPDLTSRLATVAVAEAAPPRPELTEANSFGAKDSKALLPPLPYEEKAVVELRLLVKQETLDQLGTAFEGHTPAAGGLLAPEFRESLAREAQRWLQVARKVTQRLYKQGRQRVTTAYREAVSAVDESESILIEKKVVFGRQDSEVDVLLSHAQVSRKHASVERKGDAFWVKDLGSDSGTFIDGERIQQQQELKPSSQLAIGPYLYQRRGDRLVGLATVNSTELVCRDLTRVVIDRSTRRELTILNEVSLIAHPREFLVLLGPSGSGKSTLLSALAARNLATSGDVAINGRNLYANFESLKQSIAVIPQRDVLHDQLKLEDALNYTACLRLPPDSSRGEIRAIIDELLETVDLSERRGTPIQALSGGQIKRASVANEIIAEPGLIFVDEATSGLDEHTDGELMGLFRRLAEDGRTVICVTHNLTNVEKFCHRVAVLAPGGHLAFVGTHADALQYFDIRSLGDVYLRLKDKSGEEWKQRFRKTDAYHDIVSHVESIVGRKRPAIAERGRPSRLQHVGIFVRQALLLVRRGLEVQCADRNNLLMMGGQCVMVSLLIALLFGDASLDGQDFFGQCFQETRAILFLMAISSFWFGCNNASKEIVKERSVYEREQAAGLNVGSYFTSKLVLMAILTTLQIAFVFVAVRLATGLEGNEMLYGAPLWLTGMAGITLGLAVSSYSSSENVAVTAVPLAIIPQVILAGLIGDVNGVARFIAAIFITCYWSFGSLCAAIPESVGSLSENSIQNESWWFSSAIVCFHMLVFASLAIGRLLAVSRRWALSRAELDRWMRTTANVLKKKTSALSEGD